MSLCPRAEFAADNNDIDAFDANKTYLYFANPTNKIYRHRIWIHDNGILLRFLLLTFAHAKAINTYLLKVGPKDKAFMRTVYVPLTI